MQIHQPQIEVEPNDADPTLERNTKELQDAIARYMPVFYRRAYRYLGNPHDAEDAVQDALLAAYKHLDQFKRNAKMTTWLTSIVTNSALTQLRKRPRQNHSSLDECPGQDQNLCIPERLVDLRPGPEDEYAASELQLHLRRSLGKLSPMLRNAIQLRDFDGLTTSEAAHILGVSEGTIKCRVSRARSKLVRSAKLGMERTTSVPTMKKFKASWGATNQALDIG
jgi:RNA polymerase sigma-70 factor, ECF subfamily